MEKKSLGSDHNRIKLVFGKAQRREKATKRPTGQQHISAREIETLVERMEEDVVKANIKDYEDFVQWINKHIRALGRRRKIARGRKRQKKWWDKEVAAAISQRKKLCREHRQAVCSGTDTQVNSLWEEYKDAKREVANVVQRKIKAVNANFLEELKGAGRDAARKFWQHVRNEQAEASRTRTCLRDSTTGENYEGQDCLEYVRAYMAQKLAKSTLPQQQEVGTSEGKSPRETITERELKMALNHMNGRTAAGLDKIPIQLVKKMGPKTRELHLCW